DGLPDLTQVNNQGDFKRLLQSLDFDAPPETITRRMERLWKRYSEVQVEDIFMIPLPTRQEIALAEITGPYAYRVSPAGEDIHTFPVSWHEKRISFRRFFRHKAILVPGGNPMQEITQKEIT